VSWASQSLTVKAPCFALAAWAQELCWLSHTLFAASESVVKVSVPTANGLAVSEDWLIDAALIPPKAPLNSWIVLLARGNKPIWKSCWTSRDISSMAMAEHITIVATKNAFTVGPNIVLFKTEVLKRYRTERLAEGARDRETVEQRDGKKKEKEKRKGL